MSSTMGHFLVALEALLASGRVNTELVHPVVPVLNETRGLVVRYNALLERRVKALGQKAGQGGRVRWVDGVFEKLFEPPGGGEGGGASLGELRLRRDLELDGTHLHPRYVKLILAPAIDACMKAT